MNAYSFTASKKAITEKKETTKKKSQNFLSQFGFIYCIFNFHCVYVSLIFYNDDFQTYSMGKDFLK